MAEAIYRSEDDTVDYTPAAAVSAGAVIRLPDGRPGIVKTDLAAGELGSAYTEGIFDIKKTASVVLLAGQLAWWDVSANTATFGLNQDFPAGVVITDAAAADTTVRISLGEYRNLDLDLEHNDLDFTISAVNGLSVVRTRGVEVLAFDAVAEAAQAAVISTKTLLPAGGIILEAIAAVFDIGDDVAVDINIGLASADHATDLSAVASYAAFHLDGAALSVLAVSDDNVTPVSEDTTTDLVDDTYAFFQIDARDLSDVKFYINGVAQLASSSFALQAGVALYAIAHMEKTSNDTTAQVNVKALRAYRTLDG